MKKIYKLVGVSALIFSIIFTLSVRDARAQMIPTTSVPCYALTRTLQIGNMGADVTALQIFLINSGYDIPSISSGKTPKGYYGSETIKAFSRFQSEKCKISSVKNSVNAAQEKDVLKDFLINLSEKSKKEMEAFKIEYKRKLNLGPKSVINLINQIPLTAQVADTAPSASIILRKYEHSRKVNYVYPMTKDTSDLAKFNNTDISWIQDKNNNIISSLKMSGHKGIGDYDQSCPQPTYSEHTWNDLGSPKGQVIPPCTVPALGLVRGKPAPADKAPVINTGQRIGGISYKYDYYKDNNYALAEIIMRISHVVNESSKVFIRHNGVTNGNNIWAYDLRVTVEEIFVKDYTNGQPNFYTRVVPCNRITLASHYGVSSNCIHRIITAANDSAPYEVDVTPVANVPFYQYSIDIVNGPTGLFDNNRPSISSSQVSSQPNSTVSITGSGFGSTENWVKISNANSSYTISGVSSSDGTSITFTMPNTDVLPVGDYSLSIAGYDTKWSSPVRLVIGNTPTSAYTTNVITRIGSKVLTSSEANGCVSSLISPNGSGNTAGCVRSFTNQAPGTYSVVWQGGYPAGADTTKKPTISPSYPQTLGDRPAGVNPITFYIDFKSAPVQPPVTTYTANIITRIGSKVLTSAEANGCVANIKKNGINSAGGCVYTLTNLPPGNSYQVEWLSGYPAGADTTKKPTVSPSYPQTLGDRPAGVNPITFYIDFQAAAPTNQPITVLPWTGPTSVQASSTFSYKLNWSGGPIIPTDNHGEWTIFVFFSKPGEATSFYNGGLYPSPAISTWSGGVTSIPTSISVPYGTPPGTYEVYTGIFRGPVRQELVLGSGVTPKYQNSREYKVGMVVVTSSPIIEVRAQTSVASVLDALGGFFRKLYGFGETQ